MHNLHRSWVWHRAQSLDHLIRDKTGPLRYPECWAGSFRSPVIEGIKILRGILRFYNLDSVLNARLRCLSVPCVKCVVVPTRVPEKLPEHTSPGSQFQISHGFRRL